MQEDRGCSQDLQSLFLETLQYGNKHALLQYNQHLKTLLQYRQLPATSYQLPALLPALLPAIQTAPSYTDSSQLYRQLPAIQSAPSYQLPATSYQLPALLFQYSQLPDMLLQYIQLPAIQIAPSYTDSSQLYRQLPAIQTAPSYTVSSQSYRQLQTILLQYKHFPSLFLNLDRYHLLQQQLKSVVQQQLKSVVQYRHLPTILHKI